MANISTPGTLEAIASRAVDGDRAALEQLVSALQRRIYNLALRMLWHPEDAEDAAQEILLKIVVHLGSFRGDSALMTWALRIAANHLLHVRRSRVESSELTFAAFGDDLQQGLSDPPAGPADDPEHRLLEQEVKIGCTHAMLLCLDREHRLAYILGEVFQLHHETAAQALAISPAAFRKRLSRARSRIRAFMESHCGLVTESAVCRCSRRVEPAIAAGRVDPQRLLFVTRDRSAYASVTQHTAEMDELHDIAAIYRRHPEYDAPERVSNAIRDLLDSGRYRVLQ
jgi:RNA polymerase sigma factor (sigma-70 family)